LGKKKNTRGDRSENTWGKLNRHDDRNKQEVQNRLRKAGISPIGKYSTYRIRPKKPGRKRDRTSPKNVGKN